jgi:hypothetical protein
MNLWQKLTRALGGKRRTDDEYAFWLGEDVRPVLDEEWFAQADAYQGEKLVRKGRK